MERLIAVIRRFGRNKVQTHVRLDKEDIAEFGKHISLSTALNV